MESLGGTRNLEAEGIRSRAESTGGCVKLKTVKQIRSECSFAVLPAVRNSASLISALLFLSFFLSFFFLDYFLSLYFFVLFVFVLCHQQEIKLTVIGDCMTTCFSPSYAIRITVELTLNIE